MARSTLSPAAQFPPPTMLASSASMKMSRQHASRSTVPVGSPASDLSPALGRTLLHRLPTLKRSAAAANSDLPLLTPVVAPAAAPVAAPVVAASSNRASASLTTACAMSLRNPAAFMRPSPSTSSARAAFMASRTRLPLAASPSPDSSAARSRSARRWTQHLRRSMLPSSSFSRLDHSSDTLASSALREASSSSASAAAAAAATFSASVAFSASDASASVTSSAVVTAATS
mmetsp:Transcript_40035/g.73902  ORF Transcript_40035/g.73902 Transcript_40035/m.73902 type:complete len:231 (+) Transcript_40035:1237-1929(+)